METSGAVSISARKSNLAYYMVVATGIALCLAPSALPLSCAGIFYPAVIAYLGVSKATFAIYMTILGLSITITLPFAGKLMEKVDLRILLSAAVALIGGTLIAMSFFTAVWHWYVAGACPGGWRTAYLVFGVVALVVALPFTLFAIRSYPSDRNLLPYGADENPPCSWPSAAPAPTGVAASVAMLVAFCRNLAADVRPLTINAEGEGDGDALVQALILVLVGAFLFHVPWGNNPLAVFMVLGSYVLAGTGLAVLVSALVRTRSQLSGSAPIISTGLAMLGGCLWPVEILSPVMKFVANCTPTGWAVMGLTDIVARNQGLEVALLPTAVLLAFAAVSTGVGVKLLKFE